MSEVILPPSLKKGDTIGVFAPSSYVEREDIEKSTTIIEEMGYRVFIHPQTYEREHQSAGNHLQKSLAFQGLWQRKDIKAIWAAGGGNRCLHLLETINFERLKRSPKILIGFSDVTALLNAVYTHTNIVTFHGPVFKNLHKYKEMEHLFGLFKGKKEIPYPVKEKNIMQGGFTQGHFIGGNLSLFQYLPQTLPNDFYNGGILFLEECNEELSHIDRSLLHLKRLGVFQMVKGIIFGQFTDTKDSGRPFGYTLEDVLYEHTQGLDIPILKEMPFGHGQHLYTMPIGAQVSIDTQAKRLQINGAVTQPS